MASFGIIGEGITDQIVIENILIGTFATDEDEPVANYVQPPLDKTGSHDRPAPGGWDLVFKSIQRNEHRRALENNDYLIIQIDTDVCEDKGFDVPRKEGGKELAPVELASRVVAKLKSLMGEEFIAGHGARVIYAIAVHSIECWLLPIYFPAAPVKAAKVTGCEKAVNDERRRGNEPLLSAQEKKYPQCYRDASRPYAKRKVLIQLHEKNAGLKHFVKQLQGITSTEVE